MRRLAAALLIGVTVVAATLVGSSPARAHAALERSEPAQGAVLPASPARVLLVFTEPIELGLADIQLIGSQGVVLDSPALQMIGRTGVEFPVPALPDGSYAVTIRVVSAVDGHATSASVSFAVGTTNGELQVSRNSAGGPSRSIQALVKLVSFLSLSSLWGFSLAVLLAWMSPPGRRWALGVFTLVLIATLLALAIQAWTATGSISDINRDSLGRVFDTRFGHIWWFRLAGTIMAGGVLLSSSKMGRKVSGMLLVAVALGLCLTVSLNGHLAAHEGRGFLPEAIDWFHLAAASAWIGGVAALAIRSRSAAIDLPPDLARFTRVAIPSVAAIAVTGVVSWLWLSSSWSQLWDTGYGRLVMVKVALFAPMLGLGAMHRSAGQSPRQSRLPFAHRIGTTLLAESFIGLVILAAAAVLSSTPPSGESTSARRAVVSVEAQNGSVSATLKATPGSTGENTFTISLRGTEVTAVTIRLSLPSQSIEPLTPTLRRQDNGEFESAPLLIPLPGDWDVVANVRPASGLERELRFVLPIRP